MENQIDIRKQLLPDSRLLVIAEMLIRDCVNEIKEKKLDSILEIWDAQMEMRMKK